MAVDFLPFAECEACGSECRTLVCSAEGASGGLFIFSDLLLFIIVACFASLFTSWTRPVQEQIDELEKRITPGCTKKHLRDFLWQRRPCAIRMDTCGRPSWAGYLPIVSYFK